eukprot:2365056-Rhodomonas_salina.1
MTTWEVVDKNSFASVRVHIPSAHSIDCESDAVITMSETISIEGKMAGGLFGSLARLWLTNESFFTTSISAQGQGGDVLLAAQEPGGIVVHTLTHGNEVLLTSGAYLASDSAVRITTEMQTSFRNSLLSGTGFFLLRAQGAGKLACAGYGSLHRYDLAPGERRAVDNGHLVAWTAPMRYETGLATRSMVGSWSSGEGLMCHFFGPGTLYIQSHKQPREPAGKTGQGQQRRNVGVLDKLTQCMGALAFLLVILGIFGALIYTNAFHPEFFDQPK